MGSDRSHHVREVRRPEICWTAHRKTPGIGRAGSGQGRGKRAAVLPLPGTQRLERKVV